MLNKVNSNSPNTINSIRDLAQLFDYHFYTNIIEYPNDKWSELKLAKYYKLDNDLSSLIRLSLSFKHN